jgi:hypothetical protein
LQKNYLNDVRDMALQRIYAIKSPDTIAIEIPEQYQDTIWSALAAVCNLGLQYEADSVFRSFCIHRWPEQPFMGAGILLKVDTNYAWAKRLYLGSRVTGEPALDSFITRHGVAITDYFCSAGSQSLNNWATLTASHCINLKAFGDSLRKFPGVQYYRLGSIYGDGDHIYYTRDSVSRFTFIAGRGDCPAGCTERKFWKYSVRLNDCSVNRDTIYTYNMRYPTYMPNCNLMPASVEPAYTLKSISVYPNPSISAINISGVSGNAFYNIYNTTGALIKRGTYDNKQIDLSNLTPGFYTMVIQDSKAVYIRRFVKQ